MSPGVLIFSQQKTPRSQVQNNLTDQRVNQLEEAEWSYAINVDGTGSGDRIYWSMGKIQPGYIWGWSSYDDMTTVYDHGNHAPINKLGYWAPITMVI